MKFSLFPVYNVTSCPKDDIEWGKASARLNCSLSYIKNLHSYHCLPNSKLTTLVEFCYDRKRAYVPKDNCVVLDGLNTLLNNYDCSKFIKGCPEDHFNSDTVYKYPSCLMIDTKKQCYLEDPNCTTVSRQSSTVPANFRKVDNRIQDTCIAAIIVSVGLFTSCVICLLIWIRQRQKKLSSSSIEEAARLMNAVDYLEFTDTSTQKLRILYDEDICMRSTLVEKDKSVGSSFIEKGYSLEWRKNSVTIQNKDDNRLTCRTNLPSPTLTIRAANFDDKGEYRLCLKGNGVEKEKEVIFTVDVLGFKPKVKLLGGISVKKGDVASLVVLQSSYPEAFRTKWYKVKMKYQCDEPGTEEEIKISDKKYRGSTFDFLVINDTDFEDDRRYIVKVKNKLGEGTDYIDLKVEKGEYLNSEHKAENEDAVKDTPGRKGTAIEDQTGSALTLTRENENDLIIISNVRRVYHISDGGSDNFWISNGGRLMQMDKHGHLIQLVDVGCFNTGCHSVTKRKEMFFLKKGNVFNSQKSIEEPLFTAAEKESTWVAWCIYCSKINNDILVGLHEKRGYLGKIQRFDEHGHQLAEICGKKSFCKPLYMTENRNRDVIVSDAGKRAVMAVSEHDKEIFKYPDQSISKFFPTGICTDVSSCILVCIYENNESNIHLLNERGLLLKKLLDTEECADGPCAICIVGNQLFLGQESCQDIQVYKITRN